MKNFNRYLVGAALISGCADVQNTETAETSPYGNPTTIVDGGLDDAINDALADVVNDTNHEAMKTCTPVDEIIKSGEIVIGNTSGDNTPQPIEINADGYASYAVGFNLGNNNHCTPVRVDEVTFTFDSTFAVNYPELKLATFANFATVEFLDLNTLEKKGDVSFDNQTGKILVKNIQEIILPQESLYSHHYSLNISPNSCGIYYDYAVTNSSEIKITNLANNMPISESEKSFPVLNGESLINGGPRFCK